MKNTTSASGRDKSDSKSTADGSFGRTLFENLAARLTLVDLILGALIAALIALIIVTYKYQFLPDLKLGDISPKEIVAPQDISIEDTAATAAERVKAAQSVPAVFDRDARVVAALEEEVKAKFGLARARIAEKQPGERTRASRRSLLESLGQELGDYFSEPALEVFARQGFSEGLEQELITLLKQAYGHGIVGTRDPFSGGAQGGLLIRTSAGEERRLDSASEIRDLAEARAFLRQNQFKLAALDQTERREAVAFLESLLRPDIIYNAAETERRRREAAEKVLPVVRQIKRGKVIVRGGDEIEQSHLLELRALRSLQEPGMLRDRFVGAMLLSSMLLYLLWRYFVFHQVRHKKIRNHFVLVSLVLVLSLLTARLFFGLADMAGERLAFQALRGQVSLYYLAPVAFGAMLVALLIDVNIAILYSVVSALLLGAMISSIDLAVYSLIGSFAAIYGIKQYKERTTVVKAGITIGVVNIATAAAMDLFAPAYGSSLSAIGIKAAAGATSGILAAMFASMLLPALESLFKITTDIKLLELSNLNTPILRRMALEAPGTYHHSIIVGTLAEAAAEAIGANPLLARVAAYYHDIGKLKMPQYYVENQLFSRNKHEGLSASMSSLIIASHVKDGLQMAKEIGLMPRISDMIPQHHGTRLMTYFYQKARETQQPGKGVEPQEADFRYPGPKPQSKEAAILMICDAVEAASRTLTSPTPAQIQGMIKRIIDAIVADGQLDECDVTLKDLDLISKSLLKTLLGVYHHRIEYPGYDFSQEPESAAQTKYLDKPPGAIGGR